MVNRDNKFIKKFRKENENVRKILGDLGEMGTELEIYYFGLRLVIEGVITFTELKNMTFCEFEMLNAMYNMQQDVKNAFSIHTADDIKRMNKTK